MTRCSVQLQCSQGCVNECFEQHWHFGDSNAAPVVDRTLNQKRHLLFVRGHRKNLGDVLDVAVAVDSHVRHENVDWLRVCVGVKERAVTCGEEGPELPPPPRLGEADVYVVKPETIRIPDVERACIRHEETLEGLQRKEFAHKVHQQLLKPCIPRLFHGAVTLQYACWRVIQTDVGNSTQCMHAAIQG